MNVASVQTWFASYNPYSGSNASGPQAAPAGVAPSAWGVDSSFYNVNRPASADGMIMKGLVGGLSGYKFTKAGAMNSQFLLSQAGVGAAISGAVSIVKNVASLSHGQQSASTTVSNVITDTLQGSVSGVGGAVGAWGTNKILTSLGATAGNPLIVATVIGGALGAVALNQILNTEKLRSKL